MQKLPRNLDFSVAGYWQDRMKWSTNSWSQKYRRFDVRLAYPFRWGGLGGELAYTIQSLNGAHNEYKWSGEPTDRIVDRRQWLTLRLDY
jgi:iron complex outermembrane receptor protein